MITKEEIFAFQVEIDMFKELSNKLNKMNENGKPFVFETSFTGTAIDFIKHHELYLLFETEIHQTKGKILVIPKNKKPDNYLELEDN